MNKKITYVTLAVLLIVITCVSLFLSFFYKKDEEVIFITKPDFTMSAPFIDYIEKTTKCTDDMTVSDEYDCIANLVDDKTKEVDTLATKLIKQAPLRLKEITSKNNGPALWEYGGEDFLKNLPIMVKTAQLTRDEYITNVCNLAQMVIFGGSGMGLEEQSCRYYYTEQYFRILKNLEGGLGKSTH